MRLLLVPLVLLALGLEPVQTPPAPVASSVADVDAAADELHRQAVGALERLRQAHERRTAMAVAAAL